MSSKAYFDEIATQWEAIRTDFFGDNVRQTALRVAGVQPGKLAADVGAGSGFVTEALLGAGVRVVAIDQSAAMLDALKARFPAVTTQMGEAGALPLDDASLDYAFANMFLHHVPDPAATITDMARTLKPGGVLVITDLDAHTHEFLRTEQHDLWLGFARQDVAAWFRAAGLDAVRVENIDGETCNSDSNTGATRAEISIFVASGIKK